MPFLDGFTYHLGYSDQKQGQDGIARERGYVAAAGYRIDLAGNLSIHPLIEWARFSNAGGNPAETDEDTGETSNPRIDRTYLTLSGQLVYRVPESGTWNSAVSWTRRDTDRETGARPRDHLFQLSGGYRFPFGLGIDVGWAHITEDDETSKSIGAFIAYNYKF